jgi:hypothetical protein
MRFAMGLWALTFVVILLGCADERHVVKTPVPASTPQQQK